MNNERERDREEEVGRSDEEVIGVDDEFDDEDTDEDTDEEDVEE